MPTSLHESRSREDAHTVDGKSVQIAGYAGESETELKM